VIHLHLTEVNWFGNLLVIIWQVLARRQHQEYCTQLTSITKERDIFATVKPVYMNTVDT